MGKLFSSSIDKAAGELRKLCEARGELESKTVAAETELAALRAGSGETELNAILDGIDIAPQRARIAVLDAQLAGLNNARPALLARIAAAWKALQTARAEALRGEARKLQTKLAEHVSERDRLRAALQSHEEAEYVANLVPRSETISLVGVPDGPVIVPKSMRLAEEIRSKLTEADRLANKPAPLNGSIAGNTLAELLAVCDNLDLIAPTKAAIEAAHVEMQAAADAAWERHSREDFPRGEAPQASERLTVFTISWRDGAIDRRQSRWENAIRAPRYDPSKPKRRLLTEPEVQALGRRNEPAPEDVRASTGNFGRGWNSPTALDPEYPESAPAAYTSVEELVSKT